MENKLDSGYRQSRGQHTPSIMMTLKAIWNYRPGCLRPKKYRKVEPIRVMGSSSENSGEIVSAPKVEGDAMDEKLGHLKKTVKPVANVADNRIGNINHGSNKLECHEILSFLDDVKICRCNEAQKDEGKIIMDPFTVRYESSKKHLRSNSFLLHILTRSLDGATLQSDCNRDGCGYTANMAIFGAAKELMSFIETHDGPNDLSCSYKLILFDLIVGYIQDVFNEVDSQLERFDTFSPLLCAILDCLGNTQWFDGEQESEESDSLVQYLWIQFVYRIQWLLHPLLITRIETINVSFYRGLISVLQKLAILARIGHEMSSEFAAIQVLYWSSCKDFIRHLKAVDLEYKFICTDIPRIDNNSIQVSNLQESFGVFLAVFLNFASLEPPSPVHLFMASDTTQDFATISTGYIWKRSPMFIFVSLLSIIETISTEPHMKLPRCADWISALVDTLCHCICMSSESGMPNNERLAYGAVLAKILLNLVNSDMEIEVSLVPPSLFFKLTKKLSEFTEMIRKHKPFEMPSSVSSTDDNSSALRSESVSHSSSPLARSMSQSQSFHSQIVGGGTSVTCSTEACTFQVGDEVDGLWILANGSQRWFPGQIEMIKDATEAVESLYTIRYIDGDVQENKISAEIRPSKRKRRLAKDPKKPSKLSESISPTYKIDANLTKIGVTVPLLSQSQPMNTDLEINGGTTMENLEIELAKLGVQSARSDEDFQGSRHDDSDDDDLHFFEIPSVFADSGRPSFHGGSSKSSLIPVMQFDDLSISGPLDPNNNSLSASLLRNSMSESGMMSASGGANSLTSPPMTGHEMSERSMWNSGRLLVPKIDTGRTGRRGSKSGGVAELTAADSVSTKVASWAGDESDRTVTQRLPSFVHVGEETPTFLSMASNMDDLEIASLSKIFCMVAAVLINRSVHSPSSTLNEEFCSVAAPISVRHVESNTIFCVREYLNTVVGQYCYRHYCMIGSTASPAHTRLMKLLSASPLNSCISTHMKSAELIGGGAFGSVFKLSCTSSCRMCWKKDGDTYAIKRISRESSARDLPAIINVYNEVTCLETLGANPGVCKIRDFGVDGADYCIMMECGKVNVGDWRAENFGGTLNHTEDFLLLLLIYHDLCLIIKSVHEVDIVHFDIKCCNFVFRGNVQPSVDILSSFLQRGEPSGIFFLCDFGESLPNFTELKGKSQNSVLMRSRGTLQIQCPEMLALSESSQKLQISSEQRAKPTVSSACDVWSMGCLLVELLTGDFLFAGRTWPDLYVSLCLATEIELPLSSLQQAMVDLDYRVPRFVQKLVSSVLKRDPERRLAINVQCEWIVLFLKETNMLTASKKSEKDKTADIVSSGPCDNNTVTALTRIGSPRTPLSLNPQEQFQIPCCVLKLKQNAICLNIGFDRPDVNLSRCFSSIYSSCPSSTAVGPNFMTYTDVVMKEAENLEQSKSDSSLSQISSAMHHRAIAEFCSLCSELLEVRVGTGPFPNVGDGIINLDIGFGTNEEIFARLWQTVLQQCQDCRSRGGRILISAGYDQRLSKEQGHPQGQTNMSLSTILADDYGVSCSCSRYTITCASLLAGLVTLMDDVPLFHLDGHNPLTLVDRVLPGISQVCCQITARNLMEQLLGL